MAKRRPSREIELKLLELEMARQLIDAAEMARRMEIQVYVFSKYFKKGFPSEQLKARVEKALGWVPIWSKASVCAARRACFERFGYDPAVLSISELETRGRERGVRFSSTERLPEMVETFLGTIAVEPKFSLYPTLPNA